MPGRALRVRVIRRAEARRRWTMSVPGRAAHRVAVVAEAAAVLVSDGWGIHPGAVRLHAYDIVTGEERAAFRSGTAIRCLQPLAGSREVIAASDTRLHRLTVPALEERQRWTTRIPRFADSMAVVGDRVLLANWYRAGVSVVDLTDGSVRRRPTAEMVLVVPADEHPLLVSGRTGGVWQVDLGSMRIVKVLDAPPAVDAAWAAGRLWLIEGIRATVASTAAVTSVEPGLGGRVVRGYPVGSEGAPVDLEIPETVQRISTDGDRLWAAGDRVVLVVDPLDGTATSWGLAAGLRVLAIDPASALVIAGGQDDEGSTPVSCFELQAEVPRA